MNKMNNMNDTRVTYLTQGEFRVSRNADEELSTILGSCVAVCLWDPIAAMGGMNHFLLPGVDGGAKDGSLRYGVHAMEQLINALLKMGAYRNRLEAKLFGGARISSNLRDVGSSNAAFAREFLQAEGIPCRAESLGGSQARRVIFRPATGHARQMLVPDSAVPAPIVEMVPASSVARSNVTLF